MEIAKKVEVATDNEVNSVINETFRHKDIDHQIHKENTNKIVATDKEVSNMLGDIFG